MESGLGGVIKSATDFATEPPKEPPYIVPYVDRPRSDVSATNLRVGRKGAPRGGRAAGYRRAPRRSRLGWRLLRRFRRRLAVRANGLWQLHRPLRRAAHEPGRARASGRRHGGGG